MTSWVKYGSPQTLNAKAATTTMINQMQSARCILSSDHQKLAMFGRISCAYTYGPRIRRPPWGGVCPCKETLQTATGREGQPNDSFWHCRVWYARGETLNAGIRQGPALSRHGVVTSRFAAGKRVCAAI